MGTTSDPDGDDAEAANGNEPEGAAVLNKRSRSKKPSASTPPTGRKPVTKTPRPAPSRAKKREGERREQAPPRKWWEQPWLWFGVIVATVLLAGGISYAVDTDPDDVKPVGDTAAFCAAVTNFRQTTAGINFGPDSTPEQLKSYRQAFNQVQDTAPPEIKATVDDLARNAYDTTIAAVQEMHGTPSKDLERVHENELKLAAIERQVRRSTTRYEHYVNRACQIDLLTPPPTTATPPEATVLIGPGTTASAPAGGPPSSPPSSVATAPTVAPSSTAAGG